MLWEQRQTKAGLVCMLLPFLMFGFEQKCGGRLSTLLAPVIPLCNDFAYFSCKISHGRKCLRQVGGLVTLGRLQS